MGRVKKSYRTTNQFKRAQSAPKQKVLPPLVDILTTEGFQWQSKQGTKFLNYAMCREVVSAMVPYIEVSRKELVTGQLTRMFDTGVAAVKQGSIPDDPADFWKAVAKSVLWMKKVDGETLHLFALKVLSARITALKAKDEAEATGLQMKAEELGTQTELTRAVDQYAKLLPAQYSFWRDLEPTPVELSSVVSTRSIMPRIFLPWWIEDDANQGSEEETIKYKQLLEMGGSLTIKGSAQDEEQGAEEHGENEGANADGDVDMEAGEADVGTGTGTGTGMDEMDMDEQPSHEEYEEFEDEEDVDENKYKDFLDQDADYKLPD